MNEPSFASNRAHLEHVFAETAKGNGRPFLDAFAEDASWTVMGRTGWSKTYRGKPAILNDLIAPLLRVLAPPLKTMRVASSPRAISLLSKPAAKTSRATAGPMRTIIATCSNSAMAGLRRSPNMPIPNSSAPRLVNRDRSHRNRPDMTRGAEERLSIVGSSVAAVTGRRRRSERDDGGARYDAVAPRRRFGRRCSSPALPAPVPDQSAWDRAFHRANRADHWRRRWKRRV